MSNNMTYLTYRVVTYFTELWDALKWALLFVESKICVDFGLPKSTNAIKFHIIIQ